MSRISDRFEAIYADAGPEIQSVPWAQLAPNPALLGWLADRPAVEQPAALVVGCGLGDDAEALSGLGWAVTAFDVAPTAIARCRERFPTSRVEYVVADILAMPPTWAGRYAVVVEIRTLQCLVEQERADAIRALTGVVAPGGRVYLRCWRADPAADAPSAGPPWPLREEELGVLVQAGLLEEFLVQDLFAGAPGAERGPTFTGVYRRP